MILRRTVVWAIALVIGCMPIVARAQAKGPDLGSEQFSSEQMRELGRIAVQNNGRYKPLDTVARESVRLVTEKRRWNGQAPLVTYLSWVCDGEQWMQEPMVSVGYLPLRRALGLDENRTRYSIDELRGNTKLIEMFQAIDEKERKGDKLDKLENEAKMAGMRLLVFNQAMTGDVLRLIPNPMNATATWFTFQEASQAPFFDIGAVRTALMQVIESFQKRDGAGVGQGGAALRTALGAIAPAAMPSARAIANEETYNRLNPFQKAWILYLIAFVILLVGTAFRNRTWTWVGAVPLAAGFAVHVYGIVLRCIAAGRPPVSNIYESMIFVAAAIVLFALIFELVYRTRIFAVTAAALGVVTLVLAENLPISADIAPLVPVLRSSTWLTFHVLTIMLGYAAAFLAGGLAFVGLGAYATGRGNQPFTVALDRFHYRVVQVTELFLGAGIILGGVWANQSWGRYWGWDPKETWALISLLVYLVITHGRFAGWLRRFGTFVASVIGLNMVIMTYYGVNYFLVGLHSYAGGTAFSVPAWVWMFVAAEVVFVAVAYFAGAPSRRRMPRAA